MWIEILGLEMKTFQITFHPYLNVYLGILKKSKERQEIVKNT